jgi:hypothetical protein
MIYPVDPKFPISQLFGENPALYPATNGHKGLDFALPEGNFVRCVFPGLVTFAGLDPATHVDPKAGYGLHVRIQGTQYLAIYAHLSFTLLKRDDQVQTGQQVGLSDNTGRSTGPHLHFELRTGSSLATCIDPLPLLNKDEKPDRSPFFYAEVLCTSLNIRRDPSTQFSPSGQLKTGDIVPVFSLSGLNIWFEHDRGFSAYRFSGDALMKIKET